MSSWTVPRDWAGETAFIIAGGPSVAGQDLSTLEGRRVVAVNSSCFVAPWCDYVFAIDARWIRHHQEALREQFADRVVTAGVGQEFRIPGLKRLRKEKPPGLSSDPGAVTARRTSLVGAINFEAHLGASRIVLLGADGKPGPGGRFHHHEPHPWPQKDDCFSEQEKDLRGVLKPLRKLGIDLVNASPGTAWPWLGRPVTLDEVLDEDSRSGR